MRITRGVISFVIIGVCIMAAGYALTFGWNFFAPRTRPKSYNFQIAERLKAHVRMLSEEIGERDLEYYPKLALAADYITKQLESYGYTVKLQEYTLRDKLVENIIARKIGSGAPNKVIIAGAHYDTVVTPGADDNASGVAAVLELARVLKNRPSVNSIEFCFFTNEEEPFFKTAAMGSQVFIRQAKAEGEDIKAAVMFDMIGYYTDKVNSQRYFPVITGLFLPNRGNFISVSSNSGSRDLSAFLVKSFQRKSRFPIVLLSTNFDPAIDFSDHWSFWKAGYPAVMVGDTVALRNIKYHTNADTWDTLDFESMACVVEGFSGSLFDLANRQKG